MTYQTITAAEEIGKLREGVVVLRILQVHGINQLVRRGEEGALLECTTIERMIEDAKKSASIGDDAALAAAPPAPPPQ